VLLGAGFRRGAYDASKAEAESDPNALIDSLGFTSSQCHH
jgi:hypothetical protein